MMGHRLVKYNPKFALMGQPPSKPPPPTTFSVVNHY
jgi:hypothetical protein